MLASLGGINFLAFAPRGRGGIKHTLAQHLSILGHAIVTIAARGLLQDVADIYAARTRAKALRQAFHAGVTILHGHVMEHVAVADRPAHRACSPRIWKMLLGFG